MCAHTYMHIYVKIKISNDFTLVGPIQIWNRKAFTSSPPCLHFSCTLRILMLKKTYDGVPIMAQWLTNLTMNHEVVCSIPGLAQRVKDPALS